MLSALQLHARHHMPTKAWCLPPEQHESSALHPAVSTPESPPTHKAHPSCRRCCPPCTRPELLAQGLTRASQEHWFTIRQIAGEFWDFNSLFPAPRPLTLTYLETFLATLREQGYSIFVIMGTLPASGTSEQGNGSGAYYTPQQVGRQK